MTIHLTDLNVHHTATTQVSTAQLIFELPGWLKDQTWFQKLVFRRALKRVHTRFAVDHAEWVDDLFDDHFLQRCALPLVMACHTEGRLPTPTELAEAWDKQFNPNPPAVRQKRLSQMTPVAAIFLRELQMELGGLAALHSAQTVATYVESTSAASASVITVKPVDASVPTACLTLTETLDGSNYQAFIEAAKQAYDSGVRQLLIDLKEVKEIRLSGFFALQNVARLFSGRKLVDPTQGWQALRASTELRVEETPVPVKLIDPQPEVEAHLRSADFEKVMPIHHNL